MKHEIIFTETEQIWELQRIAKKHGYVKTADAFWTQIFENEAGDTIICNRDDVELDSDPCKLLSEMLDGAAMEKAAAEFVSAIKEIAEKPQNMENLESYLSRHFGEWLEKFADTPEGIAAEMRAFAKMES